MKIQLKNLEDTDKFAKIFAEKIKQTGAFVCLYGDIGVGKTTFTKSVAKYIGVEENVTSPSFVILNEYHSGELPLYHFDLYRLETEGVKTIAQELDEYSIGKVLTFVEWAEFSNVELPKDRIEMRFKYIDEEEREVDVLACSPKYEKILQELKNEYTNL